MDTHVEVREGGRLVVAQLSHKQAAAIAFAARGVTTFCYAMCHARARFRAETVTRNGASFKAWARRTYNPAACWGKLRAVVASVDKNRSM